MNSAEDAAKLEEQRLLRAMNRKSTVGLPSSRPPQKTAQPTQPVEKKPEQKPKPVENGGQAPQPEQKAPAPQPAVNNVNNGNNTASPRDPSKRHSMYNMNNELSNLKSIKDLIRKEEDRLQKTIQRTSSSEKIKPVNPPAKQTPERSFTPAPTPVSVAPNNNTAPRQRPTSVILSGGVSNPAARKSTSISHFNAPVTVKKTEPASPSKPPQTSTPVTSPQPKPTPAPSPASAPAPAPAPAPSNPSPARRPSNATAEKAKELVDKFDEITKIAKQSSSEDLSQYAPPPKKENPPPQPNTNNSTSASAKEFDDILNIISGIQSSSEPPKKPEPTSAPVKLADMKSDRSLGSKNPARLSTSDLSAIDSILNALTQPLPGSSNQPSTAPAPSSSYKNTSGPLTPIFEIRVEKPAQLPADPKAFISSVVAIGRKVINALKLADLSAFDGQRICTYVGELVSMVSYGMEIVPAPESKRRSVVEEVQAFSMVAFNFVKDADNHIHSGVWVMKNYDDQAEKVLDSLQNSLQSLKNVTKDVISNTPTKSTRLASLNDLAIETSVQAGQILSLLKNINPNMEKISEYLEELVKTVRAGIQVLGNPQEKQLVANHLKEVLQKGIQLTTSVGAADKERKELVAAIAELLRSLT